MKRNKNIRVSSSFSAIFLGIAMLLVSFVSYNVVRNTRAYAAEPGCYNIATVDGETTATEMECTDTDTDGDPIDPELCYKANQAQLLVAKTDCDDPELASASDSSSNNNNSVRPGSASNECLTNPDQPECDQLETTEFEGSYQCGKGDKSVRVSIDIGCRGNDYPSTGDVNPIVDMMFALFRFLAAGVGLVIIGSIIVAGIQYTASRGNPQATEASIKRVTNSVIALLIYIFMYAIANFIVPGGILL